MAEYGTALLCNQSVYRIKVCEQALIQFKIHSSILGVTALLQAPSGLVLNWDLRRVENSSRLQLYANQAGLATRFHSGAYISYRNVRICGGTIF
jgi:hypothetical protein